MAAKIKKGAVTWVNIVKPTLKDLQFLAEEFSIHPIILEELLHPSVRSKVERDDSYLYFIYHLPVYDHDQRTCRRGEVDFIITKETVISVSYERLEPIDSFADKLDRDEPYKSRALGGTTARLLYNLMGYCLTYAFQQLRHIDEKVENIRKELFSGNERKMLEDISYVKRDLLSFYLSFQPQQSVFKSLTIVGPNFWGPEIQIYFSDLEGDYLRVLQYCINYKETIGSFEETNAQLLNTKINSIAQRITILAFLTFPLVLLTSVYQAGIIMKPLLTNNIISDFWIEFGAVIVLTLLILNFFKKKGWF
ncbi:MAG: CorA family divalent cation transporter [Candidatus Paceibacterota bacterium]|jgi:magnesium transporter